MRSEISYIEEEGKRYKKILLSNRKLPRPRPGQYIKIESPFDKSTWTFVIAGFSDKGDYYEFLVNPVSGVGRAFSSLPRFLLFLP